MTGAIIDSAGIVAGGVAALLLRKGFSPRIQTGAKLLLGVATVWFGLQLTWKSLNGTVAQVFKELCIALLAMSLGKLLGRLLHLQHFSNSIGQYANRALTANGDRRNFKDGFLLATALFCAAPIAFLASVQEGLTGFSPTFVIKAGTDGLAAMAFCLTFGWGAVLSAVPVLLFQGFLIRSMQMLEPSLHNQPALDSILAVDGLLIFCVALVILEIKKIRVTDYLPSLLLAPLLTRWLW